MQTLWQDLRYGARMLRKNPGFTLIAVLTLALGIGANTAIFSLVNAILLRPLPVAQPDQIVSVNLTGGNGEMATFSYPTYQDVRDRNNALTGLAAHRFAPVSLSRGAGGERSNERIWGYLVTGNYFDLLGVRAALGRTFTAEEDKTPNAHPIAVLAHSCWRVRFASDPNIVGQTIALNGRSFTVIGVMPENFTGTELVYKPEIYAPSQMQEWIEPGNTGSLTNRNNGQWFAVGRLQPGFTMAQAQASLNTTMAQLGREYPVEVGDAKILLTPPGLIIPALRDAVIGFSAVLMAAVALVLLLACANLAGLLLARATARRKELAVRLALGATRGRIVRQLLTESVLLALAGGALGVLLAEWALAFVSSINLPAIFPIAIDLRLDWRVLTFALIASALTGLLFGVLPTWQTTRLALVASLKDEAGIGGRQRTRLRSGLVTVQIAISLLLLVVAGLIVRSLQQVRVIGPGFTTERALALSVDLDLQGYDEAQGQALQKQLLERAAALPGVQSAALTGTLPLSLNYSSNSIYAEGQEPKNNAPEAMKTAISPRYFATMNIPLLEGREFNEQDTTDSRLVVIVNETLARRFFPSQSALGKRIRLGKGNRPLREIVGVAKNGKYFNLAEEPRMFAWQPLTQNYWGGFTLVVRTAAAPETIIAALRNEVRGLDAQLPVFDVKTLDQHMSVSLFPLRVGAVVLSGFGLLALVLAALGIYGVMAYSVAQRTREIGIRMALGAQGGDILRLIVRQGLWLGGLGITLGLLAALALTRLLVGVLAGVLPGVSATDVITFGGVLLLLVSVALLACWIPARRATKVDPMIALRCE